MVGWLIRRGGVPDDAFDAETHFKVCYYYIIANLVLFVSYIPPLIPEQLTVKAQEPLFPTQLSVVT